MQMVGESSSFLAAVESLARVAQFDVHALIEGETGTGKELAARFIHYRSSRRDRPFVPVNCGALPETLVENELFGHERGAFTDAKQPSPGMIGLADGGSLFLDEVDALTPKAQVTLLRFLQDHRYRPVGASQERQADIRLISASNRSLARLCRQGEFRDDLFFRLNVMSVELPPLRDRAGDAKVLAEHFSYEMSRRFARPMKPLHPSSLTWLERYDWPGNVRELENVIQRVFLLTDAPDLILPPQGRPAESPRPRTSIEDGKYRTAKAAALAAFDRQFLHVLLGNTRGNVTQAAQVAGKDRRALTRLLKKYGIRTADFRSRNAS